MTIELPLSMRRISLLGFVRKEHRANFSEELRLGVYGTVVGGKLRSEMLARMREM